MYEVINNEVVDMCNFPRVVINLIKADDIKELMSKWINLYELNKSFTFIFNLNEFKCSMKSLSNGLVLSNFIKRIKKLRIINPEKYNNLRESFIIVKDNSCNTFIRSIFNLTTPLSNTYIVNSIEKVDKIYNQINNNEEIDYKEIKLIKP